MKQYYSINETELLNNYYTMPIIENFQIFRGPTGNQGTRGHIGFQGDQGLQGERGYKGIMGETGGIGPVGFQGLEGEGGTTGKKGTKGDKGARGFEGHRGEKGIHGLNGPHGFKGPTGFVGPKGRPGYQGPQGPRGTKGPSPDTKIILTPDENSTAAFNMHGFYKAGDSNERNRASSGNHWRDPKRGGDPTPAIATNYKFRLEAQCPYNGYLNAFSWWSEHADRDFIASGNKTSRVSATNHLRYRNNIGLPYNYRVDCLVVKNEIPK